tara:strand:+ start:541 stop:723 length:183 start_codon:yes stop_codon:yes gene_type:complete
MHFGIAILLSCKRCVRDNASVAPALSPNNRGGQGSFFQIDFAKEKRSLIAAGKGCSGASG